MAPINPLDHLAIQNVLSRYCEALDTKNWELLHKVFVPDVDADYPFNRTLKGADAVAKAIQGRYKPPPPFSPPSPRSYSPYWGILLYMGTALELPMNTVVLIHIRGGSLGPILTHHSLTTSSITFHSDGKAATAVTYFLGCHFGQGPHEGKVLQAYGKYEDELVVRDAKGGDYEGVQGASGVWRIGKRTVRFTKRVGDERVMREF